MSEPSSITFEQGYRRLQEIAEEVNKDEVPVDRMGDLFAEGKGLDKALTAHLAEQRTRIERIERGEEVSAFRIVPPSEWDVSAEDEVSARHSQLATPGGTGEDIPF